MNKTEFITKALLELKSASVQYANDYKGLIHKYDMVFGGENFNIIYSVELAHSLHKAFNFEISLEELNNLLPSICSYLGMQCEPMKNVADLNNPVPAAYQITL